MENRFREKEKRLKLGSKNNSKSESQRATATSFTNNLASSKNSQIPSERNLIKKVKTYCINTFLHIVQSCVENPKHFCLYNMKNKNKRKIFRLFKSDISKIRNFVLLDIPMKHILEKISTIIWKKIKVRDDRLSTFNYFVNLTWRDFILFCKHHATEAENLLSDKNLKTISSTKSLSSRRRKKFLKRKMDGRDFDEYVSYIQNSDYNYGSRINADRTYLKIYDALNEKICSNNKNLVNSPNYTNTLFSHNNFVFFITSQDENNLYTYK